MNPGKKVVCILFVLLSLSPYSFGQKSKQELEKEKAENMARIKEAEAILESTEKQKKASIGQLTALNQQIKSRQSLINSIVEEIKWYNSEIEDTDLIIQSLRRDLEELKEEYSKMVYSSYKAGNSQDRLTYLFSSETFNQLLLRIKYMSQYGEYRRKQAEQIVAVADLLENELNSFERIKDEKQQLLDEQLSERKKLAQLKKKQNQLIADLSERESEIKKELATRNEALNRINKLIEEAVRAELAARSAAENTNIRVLSTNFEGNRAKLPWPVNEGFISMGFGIQKFPGLKRVEIDNKGINIQTNPEQEISAVFKGKVTVVASIPGMNKAVIIQHGDYRTVYANLGEVFVSADDEVDTNQPIGKIFTQKDGTAELHFELWNKNVTLNPSQWLVPK